MAEKEQPDELTPFSTTQGPLSRTALDLPDLLSGDYWMELRAFLAVAKGKSFNRAAGILNTSNKTVARHVKRLQDVLDIRLIEPTAQGVILTPAGKEFAESLAEFDYRIFKISEDARAVDQQQTAFVRIGATDALGAFFIAPSIPFLQARRKHLGVELKTLINANDLRENAVDVMLSSVPMPGNDLVTEPVGVFHFVPMVAARYIAENGVPRTSDLHRHRFVSTEFYETNFWKDWKDLAAQGQIVARTDSSISYGTMIVNGVGIGLLGSYMALHPRLTPLHLGLYIATPLFIVCLKEALNNPSVRIVRNWLKDLFSKKNPWFRDKLELSAGATPYDDGLRAIFGIS